MSDLTATQKASAMYNRAKNIASGKIDLEVSGETVMGIIFLGFIYMIISSIGMNIYSKCDAMKGQPVQENLNKYLAATLTIALTIPFTLLVTKFVKNEGAVFALIYSIMGLVGSAAALNWAVKCENAKSSDKNFAALTTALYTITLFFSFYLLRPKRTTY
jgi:low temperature requirement protein LtrA